MGRHTYRDSPQVFIFTNAAIMTTAAHSVSASTHAGPSRANSARTPAPQGDLARLEGLFQSLARAARQFHTYPATSQRCVDAVQECHRALTAIEGESIVCVVTPHELLVSGTPIGRNTLIAQELARRLHDFRCKALDIDRSATPRDISTFCMELVAQHGVNTPPLNERLRRQGLERITVRDGYTAAILDVATNVSACSAVERDRQWRDAQPSAGRIGHLYPADKAWVRVDPSTPLRQVTLSGLALLVEEPAALAQMLSRVAGDSAANPLTPGDALEARCEDVARLYAALEPAVCRTRFARLAAAVLEMEPVQRRRLLKGKVLPALLDGHTHGDLLRELPDADLAEALSLLVDVETAAPELLATALDRLNLSPERRAALAPLLEEGIKAQHAQVAPGPRHNDSALRERTRQLIRVANGDATFDGFAAFDLSIDATAEEHMARTVGLIRATNLVDAQLTCVSQLIALNPDPDTAERLLRQASRLLGDLERTDSWPALAQRLAALHRTADALRDRRADVAAVITTALQAFFTPGRFARLLKLHAAGGSRRESANQLIAAAGANLTGAVITGLQDADTSVRVLELVCAHAGTFAPILAASLDDVPSTQRVPAIRALGAMGAGCEQSLSRQLSSESESVVREALQALAAVGSREAAEHVTRYMLRAGSHAAPAAEEAIWQFSPPSRRQCLRSLIRNRAFVIANPELTLRLLERTDRFEPAGVADLLQPLTPLRFRFWTPRLARVGRRAAALLQS
jgi:hypothetical protein